MLMLLLKTQVVDGAFSELFEQRQRLWVVGEQIEAGLSIFGHLDASIVDEMIYPMGGDVKRAGYLWQGEITGNPAWV